MRLRLRRRISEKSWLSFLQERGGRRRYLVCMGRKREGMGVMRGMAVGRELERIEAKPVFAGLEGEC